MEKLLLKLIAVMLVCIMTNCSTKGAVEIHDTVPPSTLTALSGSATSATTVVLNWTASTDNVGVAGYKVYRNGMEINDTASTSYTDTGLVSGTTYHYTVSAYDAAGNMSAQTSIISVTTLTVNITGGSANNNFTMLDGQNNLFGGANDVIFIWDGTTKTSVTASGQVSNATISSSCPVYGNTWSAHDVAIYGPGTYTVYTDCPAGSPGCGSGTQITFTVGAGEIGGHLLLNLGGATDVDIVNVWKPNAVFAPSPLFMGGCGSNSASTIWGWMSKDVNGAGINGYLMVEGPFVGEFANFNLMAGVNLCAGVTCNDNNLCTTDSCDPATGNCAYASKSCDDNNACTNDSCDPATGCVFTAIPGCSPVHSTGNNVTVNFTKSIFGGTNDVTFDWDGTLKTSVDVSGQTPNASLTSIGWILGCTWSAHDVAVYGPGIYTVYTGCPAGSPGCGTGNPITFTVGANELGVHLLWDFNNRYAWNHNTNMDVVNVWQPNAVFGPSPMCVQGNCGALSPWGDNPASKVWDWMSKDIDGDGVNGYTMIDGPFTYLSVNFNVMVVPNPGNPCTINWIDAGPETILSGESRGAYEAASIVCPGTCLYEIRNCNNGVLSGSYQYKSCTECP